MKNSTQYILALVGSWLNTLLIIFFFFTFMISQPEAFLFLFMLVISIIGITLNFKAAKGIKNGSQGWTIFALIMGILSIWTVYGILWLVAAIMTLTDLKNTENKKRDKTYDQSPQQAAQTNFTNNTAQYKKDYFDQLYEQGVLNEQENNALKSSYYRL